MQKMMLIAIVASLFAATGAQAQIGVWDPAPRKTSAHTSSPFCVQAQQTDTMLTKLRVSALTSINEQSVYANAHLNAVIALSELRKSVELLQRVNALQYDLRKLAEPYCTPLPKE